MLPCHDACDTATRNLSRYNHPCPFMDVFGLCDIYSCAVGDTVYIRKVTQIFAGIHPCKFRKFPVSGFYIIRDRRTALRSFTGFGFCQRFRKLSVVVQNLIGLTHGNLMVSSNVGDAFPVLVFSRNPLADFFRQRLLHFLRCRAGSCGRGEDVSGISG